MWKLKIIVKCDIINITFSSNPIKYNKEEDNNGNSEMCDEG